MVINAPVEIIKLPLFKTRFAPVTETGPLMFSVPLESFQYSLLPVPLVMTIGELMVVMPVALLLIDGVAELFVDGSVIVPPVMV